MSFHSFFLFSDSDFLVFVSFFWDDDDDDDAQYSSLH